MAVLDVLGSPATGAIAGGLSRGIQAGQQTQLQRQAQQSQLATQQQARQLRGAGERRAVERFGEERELRPLRRQAAEEQGQLRQRRLEVSQRQIEPAPQEFTDLLKSVVPGFDPPAGQFTREEISESAGLLLRQRAQAQRALTGRDPIPDLIKGINARRSIIVRDLLAAEKAVQDLNRQLAGFGVRPEQRKQLEDAKVLQEQERQDALQRLRGLDTTLTTAVPALGSSTLPSSPGQPQQPGFQGQRTGSDLFNILQQEAGEAFE